MPQALSRLRDACRPWPPAHPAKGHELTDVPGPRPELLRRPPGTRELGQSVAQLGLPLADREPDAEEGN